MGIVVNRFLQSEIESIGGSPAPDARDLAIRDALLGGVDVLLNTTEYDLDSSERGRAYWRHQKHVAPLEEIRRLHPQEPVEILRSSRSPPTWWHPTPTSGGPRKRTNPALGLAIPQTPATAANQVIAPIPEI